MQVRSPIPTPTDRHIDYWQTKWGKLLQKLTAIENGPSIDSRDGKLFRRRFRVPWQVYCDLVLKCRNERVFNLNSLRDYDVCGTAMCAIEIKLLGVLRMLGWNWISDDVAEATGMGESTVRSCFHLFCTNFVNKFYHEFIYRPKGVKLQNMMDIYERMGLPGCISSTDCVHIKWDRCPVSLTYVKVRRVIHPLCIPARSIINAKF